MSSTNAGSIPDLSRTALSIPYNKESAEVSLKAPFLARVMALRTARVTTISSGLLTRGDEIATLLRAKNEEKARLREPGPMLAAFNISVEFGRSCWNKLFVCHVLDIQSNFNLDLVTLCMLRRPCSDNGNGFPFQPFLPFPNELIGTESWECGNKISFPLSEQGRSVYARASKYGNA